MSEVVVRWLDGSGVVRSGGEENLQPENAAWAWIDVKDPDVETLSTLTELFEMHPLIADDILHNKRRAKLDIYLNGSFLVWLIPTHRQGENISTHELDVFMSDTTLITFHNGPDTAVSAVARDARQALSRGPEWLLHGLLDLLVDSSLPLVDGMGEELSVLEDSMLVELKENDVKRLHEIRRQLVRMHRLIAPERDVIRGLGRERGAKDEEIYRYFQDIGDHMSTLLDSIETYQDVGASVMDVYLSVQNNRMNLVMKQLTIVATLFMPLTFISGMYGMNVTRGMWPPVDAWWSFPLVVGVMAAIAIGMSVYFKKKKWM
ncbi:MAG: magnesium/cobalt transporter CorA [Actinobacteria bacterium]|nr:magnesium/cobalt transporter CorA [Actinomycetota bacterium]